MTALCANAHCSSPAFARKVTLSKALNRNLALFTSDLYYILPKEFVDDLISRYLKSTLLNARTLVVENKLRFLQIICDAGSCIYVRVPFHDV